MRETSSAGLAEGPKGKGRECFHESVFMVTGFGVESV